jgi:hypothetical protein
MILSEIEPEIQSEIQSEIQHEIHHKIQHEIQFAIIIDNNITNTEVNVVANLHYNKYILFIDNPNNSYYSTKYDTNSFSETSIDEPSDYESNYVIAEPVHNSVLNIIYSSNSIGKTNTLLAILIVLMLFSTLTALIIVFKSH